ASGPGSNAPRGTVLKVLEASPLECRCALLGRRSTPPDRAVTNRARRHRPLADARRRWRRWSCCELLLRRPRLRSSWKLTDPLRSGASCHWGSRRGGYHGYECAGGGVEEEVVAGIDDHEQHERRVERSERAHERAASVVEQAGADDQRVADVHAGDGGVGVVERADET